MMSPEMKSPPKLCGGLLFVLNIRLFFKRESDSLWQIGEDAKSMSDYNLAEYLPYFSKASFCANWNPLLLIVV